MAKRFSKLLAETVRENRSYWYRWVDQHSDEISEVFATQARPPWSALVKAATDSGAVDENGRPPTREALRKAWLRLQQDRARRSGAAVAPRRQSAQPAPTPWQPAPPAPVTANQADPTRPPSSFSPVPVKLKSRLPLQKDDKSE
jgi:hypothetical protein